jgi:hypothetical protein
MDEVWIKVGAVAHILGLSARAVRKLAHTERWPTRVDTPTKAILYRRSDVLAYKAHYGSTKGAAPEPSTPGEWQIAVDAAHALLQLDSSVHYGLIETSMRPNTQRCQELLVKGASLGFHPARDAAERFVAELLLEQANGGSR